MMRKWLALAVTLGILASTSLAETVAYEVPPNSEKWHVTGAVFFDNCLYVVNRQEMMIIINEQNEGELFLADEGDEALLSHLVTDGKTLYALSSSGGILSSITLKDGQVVPEKVIILDMTFPNVAQEEAYVAHACMIASQLYAIIGDALFCFDPETGVRSNPIAYGVIGMIPYKDEQLLIHSYISTSKQTVSVYNPIDKRLIAVDTGSITTIDTMLYDGANDRILIVCNKEIIALMPDGSQMTVGYLLAHDMGVQMLSIGDGRIAVFDEGIHVLDVSKEAAPPVTLRILSDHFSIDAFDTAFMKQHPGILLTRELPTSGESKPFSEQMATRSASYDLIELPMNAALQKAIEKGYFVPIEENADIDGIYPFVKEHIITGETVAAFPVALDSHCVAYSQYALETLGLSASDLPTTYEEFLTFCLDFDPKYGDVADDKGITLFAKGNDAESASDTMWAIAYEIQQQIINGYYDLLCTDEQAANRQILALSTLMDKTKALSQLNASSLLNDAYEPPALKDFYLSTRYRLNLEPNYLFTVYGSVLPDKRHYALELLDDFVPIPLGLFEGARPQLLMEGYALVINPYSDNIDLAKAFLSEWTQAYITDDWKAAFSTQAEPSTQKAYADVTFRYEARIHSLCERSSLSSDEAEKRDIQGQIDTLQKELNALDTLKWHIKQAWLDDYRHFLDNTQVIFTSEAITDGNIKSLLWRFMKSNLTGSECVNELMRIFSKELLENVE